VGGIAKRVALVEILHDAVLAGRKGKDVRRALATCIEMPLPVWLLRTTRTTARPGLGLEWNLNVDLAIGAKYKGAPRRSRERW